MTYELRPYQERLIDDIRFEFKHGKKRVCAVAPCGAGKTVMTGFMTRRSEDKGKRILFMVHRQELIQQTSDTFSALGIRHGIISPRSPKNYSVPVQIASVQTLARRLAEIPKPDFLICDECHHIVANTYKNIIDYWRPAVLGLTATPIRLRGDGLGDMFQSLVIGPAVKELIALGNLSPYKYFAPPSKFDPSEVKVKFGEFVQKDVMERVDNANIIGDLVKYYRKLANGKRAICYCVNRAHSEHVAQMFNAAGISAMHVDGETPTQTRTQAISDFRAGRIKILTNAELFGEGFDVPAMEAVILARPTQSLTLYIQQAMRALRADPGNPSKCAVIIDHVGNVFRHGMPDEEREWSLETKPKQKRESMFADKVCPRCGLVVAPATHICPSCKYEWEIKEKKKEQADGELVQIESVRRRTTTEMVKSAKTFDEIMDIAMRRGLSTRWAEYQAKQYGIAY